MRRLLEDNPRNKETIFPYIGGEEVNTSPTHAHYRYVINFRDYPLRRADAELVSFTNVNRPGDLERVAAVIERGEGAARAAAAREGAG